MDESKDMVLGLVYNWQEDVENLERYGPGGYHPVQLGDDLDDGRYHIVHKLGNGAYSTVWLAKDRRHGRYVALKIIVAEFSSTSNESHILHLLEDERASNPDIVGGQYLLKLIGEFTIDGPNGLHTCLVSEPTSCSLAVAREVSVVRLFPLQIARAIAAKIIMGLAFLHGCGVVHGDLHTNNVLLQLPNIDKLSTDELYQRYYTTVQQSVTRIDGNPLDNTVPPYTVVPMRTAIACEDVTDANILIADFGEAYLANNESRPRLNTPVLLCPPEALLGKGIIGMPADIWTLACTLFEVLGKSTLFEAFGGDPDTVVKEMVSALGKPDEPWWSAWQNRDKFFREDGSWVPSPRGYERKSRALEERIAKTRRKGEDFDEAEKDALVKMMAGMLKWAPEDRVKIEDVLSSEWMERYGKPAIAALSQEPVVDTTPKADEAPIIEEAVVDTAPKDDKTLIIEECYEKPIVAALDQEPSVGTPPKDGESPKPVIDTSPKDDEIPAIEERLSKE
ncbi:MAG: hypothetical protein Q9170_008140 [Blastenia crenularia]